MIFFILFLCLLLLLVVFAVMLMLIPFAAHFEYDSESDRLMLTILWLEPLVRLVVTVKDMKPVLSMYLFKKCVLTKSLQMKKTKEKGRHKWVLRYLKTIKLRDSFLRICYGWQSPLSVGIAYGILSGVLQFLEFDTVENIPDFLSDTGYITIMAAAKISIGESITNYFRSKNSLKRRCGHGTVEYGR